MPKSLSVAVTVLALTIALGAVPASAGCPPGTSDPGYCTPSKPEVTTTAAADVTNTGATLKGTVNPNGASTTYHFEYGTTTSYGGRSADQALAETDYSAHAVAVPVTGLKGGTQYHFRLVATNGHGDATPGADQTFTTAADTAGAKPTATTAMALNVLTNSATLTGLVNPQGSATEYAFQYGTTTSYGTNTKSAPVPGEADSLDHPVSTPVTGLQPGTTYHYRLVAGNAAGLAFGQDRTFTTPGASVKRKPRKLSLSVSPKRRPDKPYVYRARGRLTLPSGITPAQGCNGVITVRLRRGDWLVGRGKVFLSPDCTYAKRVYTYKKTRRMGEDHGTLTVRAYFEGNDRVGPAKSPTRTVKYGEKRT